MRRHALAALAIFSAVGLPAEAAEFIPGWKSDVVWDSNVLQSSTNEESDFAFRNGPTLRVREPKGDLTYDATYQLRYEAFTRLEGINAFDHLFNGQGAWRAAPTTTVSFSDYFAYTSDLEAIFDTTGVGPSQVASVSPERQRLTSNSANASMVHQLGPLWQVTVSGSNQYYNYENPNQSDSLSTTGTAELTRRITPRLIAGGGVRLQRQEFLGTSLTSDRGTNFYQGFGVLQYSFSPTLRFVAQGGPAYAVPDRPDAVSQQSALSYFRIDPATCQTRLADGTAVFRPTSDDTSGGCAPSAYVDLSNGQPFGTPNDVPQSGLLIDVPFVGEQQSLDPSINYFGRLSIEKSWRHWASSIAYERTANSASGLGTSTTLNVISGDLEYRPSAMWEVKLSANYSTQTLLSTGQGLQYAVVPGTTSALIQGPNGSLTLIQAPIGIPTEASLGAKLGNGYELTSYLVELRAERRISRHLTLDGSASWFQQEQSGDLFDSTNQTIYKVVVGFTWNFDPIPL